VKAYRTMLLTISSALSAGALIAADADSAVQIGRWSCSQPPPDRGEQCDPITFAWAFGGQPEVVVSFDALLGSSNQAGVSVRVYTKSEKGFTVLVDGVGRYEGSWIAVGPPPPKHVTVNPKYVVMLVVYAPPGKCSVSYSAASSAGTTTSASRTFRQNYSVSVGTQAGQVAKAGQVWGLSYGQSTTDKESLDIGISETHSLDYPVISYDGIDLSHDRDFIRLWLNPTIDLAVTSSSAVWAFSGTSTPVIEDLYVGWLNGHTPMPEREASVLLKYGITSQDFPSILQRDPLANAPYTFDPPRYLPVAQFPYDTPYSPVDAPPSHTYTVLNSSLATTSTTAEDDYSVTLTRSVEFDGLGIAKASLTNMDTWRWTNSATRSTKAGTSAAATIRVGGPSYGYPGPTRIEAYRDTVYGTFAFRSVDAPLALQGTLLSAAGKRLAATEVSLVANSVTHRTFTNAKGEFRFFGKMEGPLRLQANGVTRVLSSAQPTQSIELRLKQD
jgi:hypothetical protein